MRLARRLFSFALAALVTLAAATPLEALACGSAAPCPMMKLMKGTAKASCHSAGPAGPAGPAGAAGMSTPMGCCANPPAAPVAPTVQVLAPAPAAVASAPAVDTPPTASFAFAAPRADRAEVGLYTLNAVWRI